MAHHWCIAGAGLLPAEEKLIEKKILERLPAKAASLFYLAELTNQQLVFRMKTFLVLFAVSVLSNGHSQTKEDWARTVNWDGVSHWSKYIQESARYMGPNALTIPFIGNGSVDSNTYIGATAQLHFSKGDNTQNMALYGNYCLVKDVVTLDIAYIPVEFYQMSDAIKKERHVYYANYYHNKAKGDIILNTSIRLLKKLDKKIRLTVRAGYRFASSSGLASARFTDGMGYYIDISFGKPLSPSLQWIGMTGFYCWQINDDRFRQNDAFLYGSGLEWNRNGWKAQGYCAGYLGYIFGSGDKPIVIRANAEKKFSKTSLLLRLQQGLQDFKYSSVELGMKYFLKRKAPSVIK